MDYRSLYDKDYIGAWDLDGGDLTVTIKKCVGGELTSIGGRKSKKPVVFMTHTDKGLCLNATNGKTIANLYGNHVEKWAGKKITLFKSMTRSPQGDGDVECIRVRPKAPNGAGDPPTDDEIIASIEVLVKRKKFDEAQDLASNITDEELRKDTDARIQKAKLYLEQKEAQTKTGAPEVDYEALLKRLQTAKDVEILGADAELIGLIPGADRQNTLAEAYKKRREELRNV